VFDGSIGAIGIDAIRSRPQLRKRHVGESVVMELRPPSRALSDERALDLDLVDEIRGGSTEALTRAYGLHSAAVFRFARCVVGRQNLAEEVVQDVFLRLWNEPERFDAARGSLRSWLMTQAHGKSIDVVRSEAARSRREEREARLAVAGATDGSIDDHLVASDEMRVALASLSEPEREAIGLAYFVGYSYREVAERLGVPEGTIKNRIRKGLARLRVALVDEREHEVAE
jgi:RNA polymerase sigma-70 factor, ECF subfamily